MSRYSFLRIGALLLLLLTAVFAVSACGSVPEDHTHQYIEREVAPTCTEGGYCLWVCACGDSYREDEISPLGHTMGSNNRCAVCDAILPVTDDSYFAFELLDDGTYEIRANRADAMPSVVRLPDIHDGKPVTRIASSGFAGCRSMAGILIPSCVTHIGDGAFLNCDVLTAVVFDEGSLLSGIGENAFRNCTGLTDIAIPSGVTAIGAYAFGNCRNLVSLTFGENSRLTNIGDSAFYYCRDLADITIPSGVTAIGAQAFRMCFNLGTVNFAEGSQLTSIGEQAFYSCCRLMRLTIPQGVTSIGAQAFSDCYRLVEVYNLSDSFQIKAQQGEPYALVVHTSADEPSNILTDENGYVFYENGDTCRLLGYEGTDTVLSLPESFHGKQYTIHKYAFSGFTELRRVTIPSGVTEIGSRAFYECCRLETVVFGENSELKSIGLFAFYVCGSLTDVTCDATDWRVSPPYFFGRFNESAPLTADNLTSAYTDCYWKRD